MQCMEWNDAGQCSGITEWEIGDDLLCLQHAEQTAYRLYCMTLEDARLNHLARELPQPPKPRKLKKKIQVIHMIPDPHPAMVSGQPWGLLPKKKRKQRHKSRR